MAVTKKFKNWKAVGQGSLFWHSREIVWVMEYIEIKVKIKWSIIRVDVFFSKFDFMINMNNRIV